MAPKEFWIYFFANILGFKFKINISKTKTIWIGRINFSKDVFHRKSCNYLCFWNNKYFDY